MTDDRKTTTGRAFLPLEYLRYVVQAKLRTTTKLVAYTLLGFANGHTGSVRVRQCVLAESAGLRPRAFRLALRELERSGMVATTYLKGPKLQTNLAVYTLRAPAPTCRTLAEEAPASACRTLAEAAAHNDKRQRRPRAAHSDLGDLIAPAAPPDGDLGLQKSPPSVAIWKLGVAILTSAGRVESSARSLLGKWIREHGEEEVARALGGAATRADPAAYVTATLSRRRRQANAVEVIPLLDEEHPQERRRLA